MVSIADAKIDVPVPGVRLLGSLQVIGQVAPLDGTREVQINGATLYELARPLIPQGFRGKVNLYIHVVEILDPPQDGAAKP